MQTFGVVGPHARTSHGSTFEENEGAMGVGTAARTGEEQPRIEAMNAIASQRIRQGLGLDQKTLSFVTATRPAEAYDDSISGAFRFRAPREQGIARRQIREILEANAAQARRAGGLHHQQIPGAAAPMAYPLRVQRLDHHQFRGAACLFRQALAFLPGKLGRGPMCLV